MIIKKIFAVAICCASFAMSASAFADNSAILGKWALAIDFQGQLFEMDLTVSEESGNLTGTVMSSMGGGPVSNVKFENDQLSYDSDDGQGGSMTAMLKLEGDQLNGSLSTQMGDIPLSGKR